MFMLVPSLSDDSDFRFFIAVHYLQNITLTNEIPLALSGSCETTFTRYNNFVAFAFTLL